MAFNGRYLVKVGSYEIPLSLMKYGSYESSPAQRQDLDSYVDADGFLHRNALEHTRSKIEFETINMTETEFRSFINNITAQYTNLIERKVHLTYYNEETGQYNEGDFYLPSTWTFGWLNKKIMDSVRIAFIEY